MPDIAPTDRGIATGPPRSVGRKRLWALGVGIFLLGLFAYSNSLGGAFIFDDFRHIRDNETIRDLSNYLASTRGYREQPNRFVAYLSFALNYRMGGLATAGYHAVNLAIHLVNALLVFAMVLLAFRTPRVRESRLSSYAAPIAFLASAMFVTHPLGTQAVTYVVQRLASLSTLLYLLSVVLFLKWRLGHGVPRAPRKRAVLYVGILVSSLLAYRTKETSFTLPVALLLAEVLLFDIRGWRRFLPIAPVGLLAMIIPATLLLAADPRGGTTERIMTATRLETVVGRMDYFRTQAVVIVEYMQLLAVPTGQSLDHDVVVRRSFQEPSVILSLAILAGLASLGGWLVLRSRGFPGRRPSLPAASLGAFGIGWFFVTLTVESSFIPIADLMYEHRAYLPSIGIFLAVAVGLGAAVRRLASQPADRVIILLGIAIGLLFASLTIRRNVVWADEVSIWFDAVSKAPGKFRPVFNLGTSLAAAHRYDEAAQALRRATLIDPVSVAARIQLGAALLATSRLPEAETELRAAVALAPTDPEGLMNLALVLARTGRRDEAKVFFRRFLAVAPPSYTEARRIAEAAVAR